jgi:Lambda phage tail tube protein, TTP
MSNAVTTTGILIKRAPFDTPTAFDTIAEITEIDPGGMSRNKIETSTHNEGTESHVLGILRQSDPTFKINYVAADATHIAVLDDIANNVKSHWQIAFPSGKTREGDGYIQTFKFDAAPVDGKQGASLTLTWAGIVTEDPGGGG